MALRAEVIDLLDREKRPNESYSDVIVRLAKPPRSLLSLVEFIEGLPPVEDDELTRRVVQIRKRSRRDRPRRAVF